MSDDTITRIHAEQNPWYQLVLKSHESEMPNYFWNGYMRHLMESNEKKAEAGEVMVTGYDGTKVGLPRLTPGELEEVQVIIGSLASEDQISFENCIFNNNADFQSFYFPTDVVFRNAIFAGDANFMYAIFEREPDFGSVNFAGNANFMYASFMSTDFVEWAVFSKANFAGMASFMYAIFEGLAVFSKTSFAESADFRNASFAENADFKNASFAESAYFKNASFADEADFSASSDTPPHKGPVSFAGATFKLAPSFFERQLHEDTDWQGVAWPEPPSSKERAGDDVRRYERLSLMMSRLEKYDDMHTFFRLSMRTKEIRDDRWNVASIMSRIYGFLFDYGWGVERAFLLWLGHILLGFGAILTLMCIKGQLQSIGIAQSFALSFSNAHSFIGLYSGAQAHLYEAAGDIPCFSFIWGVQTVIGLPLLFFLLLTIRNRFRIR